LVVVFAAFNVKPSPSAPNSSAVLLHLKASRSAQATEVEALGRELKPGDNDVPKPEQKFEQKRAKREPFGLMLCAGLGNWRI